MEALPSRRFTILDVLDGASYRNHDDEDNPVLFVNSTESDSDTTANARPNRPLTAAIIQQVRVYVAIVMMTSV